jgi:hypothetical protein
MCGLQFGFRVTDAGAHHVLGEQLDRLPDSLDPRLAVHELGDRLQVAKGAGDAGEAVPELNQAADRPLGGRLGELLLGREQDRSVLGGGRVLVRRDVVIFVDGEVHGSAPSRPQARQIRAGGGRMAASA